MTQITVSDELARQILGASPPILIVDTSGRTLCQIDALKPKNAASPVISDAEFGEIKQRMANDDGTRYTWTEVKEHLRSLAKE